jgi:hypothetical protein
MFGKRIRMSNTNDSDVGEVGDICDTRNPLDNATNASTSKLLQNNTDPSDFGDFADLDFSTPLPTCASPTNLYADLAIEAHSSTQSPPPLPAQSPPPQSGAPPVRDQSNLASRSHA